MADRSHLTPVQTTDKRGRTTTVYRNLSGRRSAAGTASLPPTPALPGSTRTGRSLPKIALRSSEEMDAFLSRCPHTRQGPREPLRRQESRAAASLAIELAETGALPEEVAVYLLDEARAGQPEGLGDQLGGLAIDALRIAARLWPRHEGTPLRLWCGPLLFAACGLRTAHPAGPYLIATERELESAAAVAEFLIRNDRRLVTGVEAGEGHIVLYGTQVANQHLDALLRERPHDLDRIIAYTDERGMDPDSREAVDDLRAWLDTETPAVGDGWL